MVNFCSVNEILEYAISREAESNEFYLNIAKQKKDPAVRKIFNRLANDELVHLARLELELMKEGRVVVEVEKTVEIEDFVDILAFETDTSIEYREALLVGIQKEKVSFRFYVNLVGLTQDKDCREVFLELAEEEAKHKVLLELEYETIAEKNR